AIGAAVMPQVYGNENAGFTVGACLANLKTGGIVPTSPLNLTFGTYGERPVPYPDYTTWQGPRTIYTGENTPLADWPRLVRQPAPPPPAPEAEAVAPTTTAPPAPPA